MFPILSLDGVLLPLKKQVCELGVSRDFHLLLDQQVEAVAMKAFTQLQLVHQLQPFLCTIAHALTLPIQTPAMCFHGTTFKDHSKASVDAKQLGCSGKLCTYYTCFMGLELWGGKDHLPTLFQLHEGYVQASLSTYKNITELVASIVILLQHYLRMDLTHY